MNDNLSPFFRPHLLLAADDVASIDAPADLIHRDCQTADAALINISLLHTLFCHFFYCLLDCLLSCHVPLLSSLTGLFSSSPWTPIQNVYFRSEAPVRSGSEFFLHRRYTRFGFSPLYPQRRKRKCWTRDTRPQPPHTSSISPSPFWNKRPSDES